MFTDSPARWARGYLAMMRWEIACQRRAIPVRFAAQVTIGAGLAAGIGLLHDLPAREALFAASGVVVVAAVMHGLFAVQGREANEFARSLPLPRGATTAARLSSTVLIGLPGMAAVLVFAIWRYDLSLAIGWKLIPAMAIAAFTAALAGYTLGPPGLAAQLILLVVIGFAPVSFPPERLPAWLDQVHDWLPFEPLAIIVRTALTQEPDGGTARAYLTVLVWVAVLLAVAGRRRQQ